jgi:hypothetical protein
MTTTMQATILERIAAVGTVVVATLMSFVTLAMLF